MSSWVWAVCACLVLGTFIGLGAVSGRPDVAGTGLLALFFLLLSVVVSFRVLLLLSVLLHEAGHWAFFRTVGFKSGEIRVYYWRLTSTDKGLKLCRLRPPMNGGLCRMVPPDDIKGYAWKLKVGTLGGPVATVVTLGLSAVMIKAFPISPYPETTILGSALWSTSHLVPIELLVSNALLFLGLFGVWKSGQSADVPILFSKIDPGSVKSTVNLSHIMQAWATGTRARDWDASRLAAAVDPAANGPLQAIGHLVNYYYCLDTGQERQAIDHIELAWNLTEGSKEARAGIAPEAAFARAYLASNLEGAQSALDLVDPYRKDIEGQRARARAAVWLLKGEFDLALSECETASSWVVTNSDTDLANVRAELEWIDTVRSRVLQHQSKQGGSGKPKSSEYSST